VRGAEIADLPWVPADRAWLPDLGWLPAGGIR
jgi:8-oxo-dGTP diphosphatase